MSDFLLKADKAIIRLQWPSKAALQLELTTIETQFEAKLAAILEDTRIADNKPAAIRELKKQYLREIRPIEKQLYEILQQEQAIGIREGFKRSAG